MIGQNARGVRLEDSEDESEGGMGRDADDGAALDGDGGGGGGRGGLTTGRPGSSRRAFPPRMAPLTMPLRWRHHSENARDGLGIG